MDWLEPFQHPFLIDALSAGALVGAVCAALSCFLVLRGWSLMGDAISHAVFPGVVLAYAIGWPLPVGGFISGLFCAVATGWIRHNSRVKEDTVLGIVFTGLFALGLVMFTKVKSEIHLNHILFGNILGIERSSMIQTAAAAGVTLAVVLMKRRDLLVYTFDPAHALTIGLNATFLHYLFLALLSATVVASLQTVGIILVVAMLITPGCIGCLLTDRFDRMLWIAIASAVLASSIGVYTSFFIDGATGPCIVLAQSLLFALSFFFAPRHGWLAKRRALKPAVSAGS